MAVSGPAGPIAPRQVPHPKRSMTVRHPSQSKKIESCSTTPVTQEPAGDVSPFPGTCEPLVVVIGMEIILRCNQNAGQCG
jgi:hypothetical protein